MYDVLRLASMVALLCVLIGCLPTMYDDGPMDCLQMPDGSISCNRHLEPSAP